MFLWLDLLVRRKGRRKRKRWRRGGLAAAGGGDGGVDDDGLARYFAREEAVGEWVYLHAPGVKEGRGAGVRRVRVEGSDGFG